MRRIDVIKESVLNILEEVKPATFTTSATGEMTIDPRSRRQAGLYKGIADRIAADKPVNLRGFAPGSRPSNDTPTDFDQANLSAMRLAGGLRASGIQSTLWNTTNMGRNAGAQLPPRESLATPGQKSLPSGSPGRIANFAGIPSMPFAADYNKNARGKVDTVVKTPTGSDRPAVSDADRAEGASVANRARGVLNVLRNQNRAAETATKAAAAQAHASRNEI
jgi:hypothetical protein